MVRYLSVVPLVGQYVLSVSCARGGSGFGVLVVWVVVSGLVVDEVEGLRMVYLVVMRVYVR